MTLHERETARARHLDDRDRAGQQPPLRVDRVAERSGDDRDAATATVCEQRVERAVAAVGEREHLGTSSNPAARRPAAIAAAASAAESVPRNLSGHTSAEVMGR